jgi:hypothetical protein
MFGQLLTAVGVQRQFAQYSRYVQRQLAIARVIFQRIDKMFDQIQTEKFLPCIRQIG